MTSPDAKKSNKNFISIGIIVALLAASAYIVFGGSSSPANQSQPRTDNLGLDTSAAEQFVGEAGEQQRAAVQTVLTHLERFGDWPVTLDPDGLGRSNPFLPPF